LIGVLMIILSSFTVIQQKTEITITGLKSGKGKVIIQVFKDDTAYQDQKPFKNFIFDKKAMANGALKVQFELEPGIYGFTMVDDENGNGHIDKNFIGIPKEGFGFSNFFMEKMKKPLFNEFKTDLKTQSKIVMKVKYM
ncbi:MAG: DUF2141 domain-containing protein, partial [Pedobacter sp.]|nr:DUF2141 domain-containing protein [Pedobacter sp.]